MEETLGERLKRLRIHRELTQTDVARYIYVTKQAVALYESDERQPTSDKLIKLSSLYNVSADYLLGIQNGQTINAKGLTTKEFELISELVAEMSEINEQLKN